jgi:Rrf2 family protein
MAANTRFAVAVHIIMVLANHPEETVSSERIAKSVCTNPVVIRRILSDLASAGIITSQLGKGGGAKLALKPKQITLDKVFAAIEPDGVFAIPEKPANKSCQVSCCMKRLLQEVLNGTDHAMLKYLRSYSIQELLKEV